MEKLKPVGIDTLENYWNNKITPKSKLIKMDSNNVPVNVIRFLNERNDQVPLIKNDKNIHRQLILSLDYVHRYVTYKSDGKKDQFQWANTTMDLMTGDCEDGAILLANILLKGGIPYWQIRLNAGMVKDGPHCFVTYLNEKDNQWYILDWTYWYDECKDIQLQWAYAQEHYYEIWYSWNSKYVFMNNKPIKLDRIL